MSSNMARRGGIAGLLAAALLIVTAILSRVAPVGSVYQTPMDYLYQVVSVLAFGAIIVAVLCLDAWQGPYPGYGRVGHIGSILAILGYAIVLLVVIINIALGGWHLTPVPDRRRGHVTGRLCAPRSRNPPRPQDAMVVRRTTHHRLPYR